MADIEKAKAEIDRHLRKEEGERLKVYRCIAGVPTIGVGCITYADGRRVTMSDPPITVAQMNRLLEIKIDNHVNAVLEMVNGECTTNQLVALVICGFNIGLGKEKGLAGSGMIRLHLEGRFAEAAAWFLKWNKYRRTPGGPLEVHHVLHARRMREAAIYLTPDEDDQAAYVPPPQAVEPPPGLAASPTAKTSVAVGASGAVAVVAEWVQGVGEVGDTLSPAKVAIGSMKDLLSGVIGIPQAYWLPIICIVGAAIVYWRRRNQHIEGRA